MNKKIYDILANNINDYESLIKNPFTSSNSSFGIYDSFFNTIKADEEVGKKYGVELIAVLENNILSQRIDIAAQSNSDGGVTFLVKFDGVLYSLRFSRIREMGEMNYYIYIASKSKVKYQAEFINKYFLYSALDTSKLKGSYFSMPRNQFIWNVKNIEERNFDDIFLPKDIMEDLHLYVDIFKDSGKILRYLKVGNPGVGKTESTIIIANELNKLGVTIIKTPICELLHSKVELANLLAPCMIIFDDIDLYLGDRNHGASSALLGDFLDVLDGTDKLNPNVGIIATTNAAHLLDLAAQRPGRFDKTLLFDDVTKSNIKNIIIKSLSVNFGITEGERYDLFINDKIINKFHDARVSGAHIFNSIKMLQLRYVTLKTKDITLSSIVSSIDAELKVIEKVRKTSFLKDKFDRSSSNGIGFNTQRQVKKGEIIEIGRDEEYQGEEYDE